MKDRLSRADRGKEWRDKMTEGGREDIVGPFVNIQPCDLGDRWGQHPISQ